MGRIEFWLLGAVAALIGFIAYESVKSSVEPRRYALQVEQAGHVRDTLSGSGLADSGATTDVPSAGAPLIGSHAYAVAGVYLDASGNPVSIRLRNPWGYDGAGDDGADDGYVMINGDQALGSLMGVVSAAA